MKINQINILKDRGIILVSGKDSKEFLQNIITNDINNVKETNSIFSGIFTPQGKYLYEFFVLKSDEGYLLDCPEEFIKEIIVFLNKYKLNSDVLIQNISNKFVVGIISNEKFEEIKKSENILEKIGPRHSRCSLSRELSDMRRSTLSRRGKLFLFRMSRPIGLGSGCEV